MNKHKYIFYVSGRKYTIVAESLSVAKLVILPMLVNNSKKYLAFVNTL